MKIHEHTTRYIYNIIIYLYTLQDTTSMKTKNEDGTSNYEALVPDRQGTERPHRLHDNVLPVDGGD